MDSRNRAAPATPAQTTRVHRKAPALASLRVAPPEPALRCARLALWATLMATTLSADELARYEAPENLAAVLREPDGIVIDAPASPDLLFMRVTVFDRAEEVRGQFESSGERIALRVDDLADGEYRFEVLSIIAPPRVSTGNVTDDPEFSTRQAGWFHVYEGRLAGKEP